MNTANPKASTALSIPPRLSDATISKVIEAYLFRADRDNRLHRREVKGRLHCCREKKNHPDGSYYMPIYFTAAEIKEHERSVEHVAHLFSLEKRLPLVTEIFAFADARGLGALYQLLEASGRTAFRDGRIGADLGL